MNHFYLERRAATGRTQCFDDLMFHLQQRYHLGTTVIVIERPGVFYGVAVKSWGKVLRFVKREMASRLASSRGPYVEEIMRLEAVHFAVAGTKSADELARTRVIFAAPDDPVGLPMSYATLYIVDAPSATQRHTLEERLMPKGLLVEYVSA